MHLPATLRPHLWYGFDPQTSLSFAHGRPSTTWSFTSWRSTVSSKAIGLQLPACPPRASNHLPQSWPWAPTQPEHSHHISLYLYKYISKGNTYKNRKIQRKIEHKKLSFLPSFVFFMGFVFPFLQDIVQTQHLLDGSVCISSLTQIACHFGPGLALFWARSG